jgi:pyridoxal phosphate enzyme (YggS family)
LSFPDFAARLAETRDRVSAAALRSGRDPAGITIIAVTKGHDFSAMTTALDHGLTELGENRVQDALPKLDRLADRPAAVHLIGQLQTNKVNKVVGRFASIMAVDRADLLDRLGRRATELATVQPVWIQVNTSGEEQKGGCSPDDTVALIEAVENTASLDLRGLMTMGRAGADEPALRRGFAVLREIRDRNCPGGSLSMGMSGDFEIAVEEGASHLRLGTTLFGPRPSRPGPDPSG